MDSFESYIDREYAESESVKDPQPLTVIQLTRQVKALLEKTFHTVWVEGELSNVKVPQSGHLYFSLKDDAAQIRAVMFRSKMRDIRFRPEDGQKVIVRGELTVYEARGEYQIIVSSMEPRGKGSLQLAFEQLKMKLAAEGLFEPSRKKQLPLFPARIGIVTSPTGAAIQDILNIVKRRFANVHLLLYPSKVQGREAAAEIVEGIRYLDRQAAVDVIIVGRGGGSIEDLWPFNEEIVARAIAAAATPIISAVGHETDFTIADFVADLRAPTPSAAAELVVQNKEDVKNRLRSLFTSVKTAMNGHIERRNRSLEALKGRPLFRDPSRFFNEKQFRLDERANRLDYLMKSMMVSLEHTAERLHTRFMATSPDHRIEQILTILTNTERDLTRAVNNIFDAKQQALSGFGVQLESLSPLAHLKRGYSIIMDGGKKKAVMRATDLTEQEQIWLMFLDGAARCTIEELVMTPAWSVQHGPNEETDDL